MSTGARWWGGAGLGRGQARGEGARGAGGLGTGGPLAAGRETPGEAWEWAARGRGAARGLAPRKGVHMYIT